MDGAEQLSTCSTDARPTSFVLVKPALISPHESHFAGGKHAFRCMANTLAACGHEVHVVCAATRSTLLAAALTGAPMAPQLTQLSAANTQPSSHSSAALPIASWTVEIDTPPQLPPQTYASSLLRVPKAALRVHTVLVPESEEGGSDASRARDITLTNHVRQLTTQSQINPSWVIIDADDCQITTPMQTTPTQTTTTAQATSAQTRPNHTPSAQASGSIAADSTQVEQGSSGGPSMEGPGTEAPVDSDGQNSLPRTGGSAAHGTLCSVCAMGRDCTDDRLSLFGELAAAVPPGRLLALVQNVHFLPCGPSGTSRRTRGLLQAWAELGGILCVSEFVQGYIQSHLPAELARVLGSQAAQGSGSVRMPYTRVVRLNTWGCFGQPPFTDFSAQAAAHLDSWQADAPNTTHTDRRSEDNSTQTPLATTTALSHQTDPTAPRNAQAASSHQPAPSSSTQHVPQASQGTQLPIIGCLKMTPEKGCSIVHALAQRLAHRYRFLLVSGDPHVTELFASLPNVKVVEPQKDIDRVLGRVCCVLVPSLWLEAWGMVVTDSLLRGIPVITSNAGALPEAGLGHAQAVPVRTLHVPTCQHCDTPIWAERQYSRQDIEPWVDAIDRLLEPKSEYLRVAREGRQAALEFVGQQAQELQTFFAWLSGLRRSGTVGGPVI